jgi:mannose-6-phosphate isomerase-like protein (cupin superfamily)
MTVYPGPMRRLVTGVDASGRSCVVEHTPLTLNEASVGHSAVDVYSTGSAPPAARPPGHAGFYDLGVLPGTLHWQIVEHKPNMLAPMHHTDTIDLDIILEGSVELGLDDGMHPLEPGDCVVVAGVDHSWRAGPAGCRLSVLSIGTPARVSE